MIIGILTSFIYLMISTYPLFSGYNYIDTFINLVCIVLMNKINEKYYHKTCNCCHKMILNFRRYFPIFWIKVLMV